jgi:hypothetical protein
MKHYILIGHEIRECSLMEWARWWELCHTPDGDVHRRVGSSTIGDVWVSTVFLGIDHSFSFDPVKPVLFETMCFSEKGDWSDFNMRRYCTWNEAEEGHKQIVEALELLHENAVNITQMLLQIVQSGVTNEPGWQWKKID